MFFISTTFLLFQSSLVISPAALFPPPPLAETREHTHTVFTQSTHINQLRRGFYKFILCDPPKYCRHNLSIRLLWRKSYWKGFLNLSLTLISIFYRIRWEKVLETKKVLSGDRFRSRTSASTRITAVLICAQLCVDLWSFLTADDDIAAKS